ncbi:helix-turn-helix domain-containing protein [Enterovirga sp. DB1703]|uniref:Helix-turn-helix domain-containing protein n=2 Tax=Enterovirga aerilata TaxID=2730920 RepID=A0A849I958_9HYPH|nr:helix-turn-helix domain-containing protein [Enterovirga sp. DB1703]NNM73928.1 helix-turn-helix domain-containing protein [Enterovirga sp. DB1703]
MKPLTIGELSRQAGVKVPTIRYYEEIGLLPPPDRSGSNRRCYGGDTVRRLRFVRHARELGFDIPSIRELLSLETEPQASCHVADSIALRHLAAVGRRIDQLIALQAELRRMVSECGHGRVAECRVIEIVGNHDLCLSGTH